MPTCLVEAPRANANEDELQVIDVAVADGRSVALGELLFVLETTKAAVEIHAPRAGVVRDLRVKVGDLVAVGAPLCRIVTAADADAAQPSGPAVAASTALVVTAKARRMAGELGVDLAAVEPVGGRVGEAEVRAAWEQRRSEASPARQRWNAAKPRGREAVIVGGGGHAACLIDALQGSGFDVIGCVDRVLVAGTPVAAGVAVVGGEDALENMREAGVAFAFVGVGGADDSGARRVLFDRLTAMGFVLPPVVHPRAVVAPDVSIGSGCHILAGATIGARTRVGDNVIVNQGSIVCHDSVLHDHVHVTPGAILAGGVTIGPRSVIGMGATILLGVTIGADCLVHNGAHISASVADSTLVDATGKRTRRPAVRDVQP